ncbi:MAG: CoA transferase [Chloroflexi bacterium]|nr:CoA transferase [Chloroflexota bacterium]MCH7837934.1 CoA transferase [Chloroflexota bacterium]
MGHLPLSDVRVIDFSVVWAGPFATMLLADLGAEVIKVENPHVLQPATRGGIARPSKAMLQTQDAIIGGYPNNEPGPRPWNYHPFFVQLYRNKKSCTVDWRRPEGLEIIGRLVAKADVFIENTVQGTLERLGITYEWLREMNEEIIVVRMPAYGLSGPYASARAFGAQLESVMGHTLLRGYRDLDVSSNRAIYSADYLAGTQGALAVMMALWHRKKTGRGQLIEIGQAENASGMFVQAFMDYALNGNVQTRIGNRSVHDAAPYGVYPCLSPGNANEAEDRWIAITVTNDEEWLALRKVMGDPAWANAADLATNAGRAAEQDLLDEKLAEWTRGFDDYDLFHRLQAAGVPAAPVLEASRLFDDPHVQARGIYQPQRLFDDVGTFRFTTPFYRLPETPATVHQPPVALGEHNDYVYRELLGVSDEEYERLKADGHIAMDFDPSIA